ncbi:unnamed protein product [Owenia fusiformis]|uniref:Uncharacterized protein n=1 Tax=Owenia fusiformis TaxID=6347 RepID=A0A8J1UFH7_OWEFU|nr:unnamed protein product [Owenia fusiformis]
MEVNTMLLLTCFAMMISKVVLAGEQWPGDSDACPGNCECTTGIITCTNLKTLPQIPHGTHTAILTKCHIPTLEDNSFKNMTNITSLKMRHLNMDGQVAIKQNAFIGLDNLQELEISSTFLLIPSGKIDAFDSLVNLKSLNLSGAELMGIDAQQILKNITRLEILDLSHNMIATLTVDLSDNLQHLVHVNLAVNAFASIDDAVNVFNKSTDLQYLDLSAALWRRPGSIAIDKLGPVFLTFTKPLVLKLNSALIPKIENDFFDNAQTISELYFTDCRIELIAENTLKKLSPIKTLDISKNPQLTMKILFSSLKEVDISELIFQDNQFDIEIDMDLVLLLENTSLEILDLSHGQLRTISPEAFSPLTKLTELDLSYNQIRTVTKLGEFLKMKTLNLQHNQLKSLDTNTFNQLYNIESLYLNDNLLKDVDENALYNMGKLEILDLSNNNITVLPDNFFFSMLNLKTLKLSQALRLKEQSKWNKVFASLWRLETLLVQNNGITGLHADTFQYLKTLQELDISGNELQLLPVGLFNTAGSTLQSVKANRNLIKTIDVKVFDKLNNLTLLDVSMNPFNCVCELGEFAGWIVNNSVVFDSNQTQCLTPASLQNTTVSKYAFEIPMNCYVINTPDLPVGFVVLFVFFILIGLLAVGLVFYLVRNRIKTVLSPESKIRYGAINDTDADL